MDIDKDGLETNRSGNDANIESDSDDNSDQDQLGLSSDNSDMSISNFSNDELWDKIGKNLEDYDENDMDMLRWKLLDL